jgi:hypothetical protein
MFPKRSRPVTAGWNTTVSLTWQLKDNRTFGYSRALHCPRIEYDRPSELPIRPFISSDWISLNQLEFTSTTNHRLCTIKAAPSAIQSSKWMQRQQIAESSFVGSGDVWTMTRLTLFFVTAIRSTPLFSCEAIPSLRNKTANHSGGMGSLQPKPSIAAWQRHETITYWAPQCSGFYG